mmetsp:Transcript_133887/g.317398  ORF Transcript_133887/g.317398 Transcript_133887/m.317398 type:complete len:211 (+) Transcript_133887:114-746(+)
MGGEILRACHMAASLIVEQVQRLARHLHLIVLLCCLVGSPTALFEVALPCAQALDLELASRVLPHGILSLGVAVIGRREDRVHVVGGLEALRVVHGVAAERHAGLCHMPRVREDCHAEACLGQSRVQLRLVGLPGVEPRPDHVADARVAPELVHLGRIDGIGACDRHAGAADLRVCAASLAASLAAGAWRQSGRQVPRAASSIVSAIRRR